LVSEMASSRARAWAFTSPSALRNAIW
jgi:hypothetical protein